MKNNLFDLTGKVAFITGGAGLLATEHALALNEYGAKVLCDINLDKANEISYLQGNNAS
jgi:NAD(P)-dependent dehydrogenase (short-subunit alcohol dehydrogenase family)